MSISTLTQLAEVETSSPPGLLPGAESPHFLLLLRIHPHGPSPRESLLSTRHKVYFRRRAAERPRDHGHGTRPSPTQAAPRGGRSRDHLVGGGRGASHVLYPDLAGRASWPGGHRGDGGERGGAQQPFLSIELSNGFSRAQSLPPRPGCIIMHRGTECRGTSTQPGEQLLAGGAHPRPAQEAPRPAPLTCAQRSGFVTR